MAELRTEDDRACADALVKQGPGAVPQAWKEGPGWRAIKGFIQRVAVAQVHATAEDFTGKPVNKQLLERAVDTSPWAMRGRLAAEATGRAITTIAKTDRQNAGGTQRHDTRRDSRPDSRAPQGPRTYPFPRNGNAGAPPTGKQANVAPVAALQRQVGIKCHNCGQLGHLIAARGPGPANALARPRSRRKKKVKKKGEGTKKVTKMRSFFEGCRISLF